MPLQIEILSKAEVEAVWKNRARAENFADYLNFINARDIGDSFRLTVDKGDKNADSARSIRHNFEEAAKERVKATRDKDGRILVTDGRITPVLVDDKPVPDAVLLRWKTDSHIEQRKQKKDGKESVTDVKVIDKLTALLIATTDVKPRGPRPEMETVTVPNATAEQVAAKTLTLTDGRVAKLRKDGAWHAPKITVVAASTSANGSSQNGTADVSASGTTAETAEKAEAPAA